MIYSSSNELRMQLQMPLYNLNVFAALSSYYRLQPPTFSLEKKQKKNKHRGVAAYLNISRRRQMKQLSPPGTCLIQVWLFECKNPPPCTRSKAASSGRTQKSTRRCLNWLLSRFSGVFTQQHRRLDVEYS